MALVRQSDGFKRYAFSVCYDGLNSLGFTYQGGNENCITQQGTDLRALHSVEGKIRRALSALVDGRTHGQNEDPSCLWKGDNFENFQVSSRTDRYVHALKNTFHVDIRRKDVDLMWSPQNLVRGLNFHLVQTARDEVKQYHEDCNNIISTHILRCSDNDIRITSCRPAPVELLPNKLFLEEAVDNDQPPYISWNARFTATSRTYLYRILCHRSPKRNEDMSGFVEDYGYPFEAGRSWRIHCQESPDLEAMRKAGKILTGTHDFTSFRGKGCYRSTPITTIDDIRIYSSHLFDNLPLMKEHQRGSFHDENNSQLISILVKGNAFLYRQVRNIVGCLVDVGLQKILPRKVEEILHAKNRGLAPPMAPAQGLYLTNVEHGDFRI
mmetsp:Transcript_498/g.855  ORF Transcript_498/g.855 Transcript_498/m.855 type:complete len:381 (-) Transcript_498:2906-4048(-)